MEDIYPERRSLYWDRALSVNQWQPLIIFFQHQKALIHWGWVMHICASKITIIGSDNGLSPGRRQPIIWTNAGTLLIQTLGTNFSEILNVIHAFSFKKMHLKMSSAKWRPFCLSLNVSVKIPPHGRGEPVHPTWSMPWLLMTWRQKEPGHQQPWYWPCSSTRII